MADEELLARLRQGIRSWNAWREENRLVHVDLSRADLSGAKLSEANLSGADLRKADLVGANLFRAKLSGANLSGANLEGANLNDVYGLDTAIGVQLPLELRAAPDPKPLIVPPEMPGPGPGPHFVMREDGVADFAPPEAIDAEGNNLVLLRAIHPQLRELARALSPRLGPENNAHPILGERLRDYLSLIGQDLAAIPFDRLWVEGLRLQHAAEAEKRDKETPPLDPRDDADFSSLLSLHGTFMMSTRIGLELIALEERYKRRPEEEAALREAMLKFAAALKNHPEVMAPEAASFVGKAAAETGAGQNPTRGTVASTATARNAALVIFSGAIIGALTANGHDVVGTAGTVVASGASLAGLEGLKKSKPLLAIARMVTSGIDKLSDDDLWDRLGKMILKLKPYPAFVREFEPLLRKLAEQDQFKSLKTPLEWILERMKDDIPKE